MDFKWPGSLTCIRSLLYPSEYSVYIADLGGLQTSIQHNMIVTRLEQDLSLIHCKELPITKLLRCVQRNVHKYTQVVGDSQLPCVIEQWGCVAEGSIIVNKTIRWVKQAGNMIVLTCCVINGSLLTSA